MHIRHPTIYNWISLFNSLTSSPGLNAGSPIYGHPSHRKASPSAQFPQLPTLPCTVKSTSSSRSSAPNFIVLSALSASVRFAASSASSCSFIPQVQSLQARRRLPALGRHSGATSALVDNANVRMKGGKLTLNNGTGHVFFCDEIVFVD